MTTRRILKSRDRVAVSSGISEPVFEVDPPSWFHDVQLSFAVGSLGDVAHDPGSRDCWVWGAGLVLRHSAWQSLQSSGFRPSVTDRVGKALSSAGDTELAMALVAVGWQQWFDPSLRLRHFMPRQRLEWAYYCRLQRANGASNVQIDPLRRVVIPQHGTRLQRWLARQWTIQLLLACWTILRNSGLTALLVWRPPAEADLRARTVEMSRGRIGALLKSRSEYARRIQATERWFRGVAMSRK
jgi:hypothetical protein